MTKICGSCGEEKSVDCFVRNYATDDTFATQCRACAQDRKKAKHAEEAQLGYEEIEPGYGHGV